MRRSLYFLLSVILAVQALAQSGPEDYVPVLLPLATGTANGAHGSLWETQLRVFNASQHHLRLIGPIQIYYSPYVDPSVNVAPRSTELAEVPPQQPGVDGAFLYIPKPLESAPHFSLRVSDTSENATSLGTEIPVVRREEAKSELVLFNIPTDPAYRATLRIYGWTPAPMPVGVKIFVEPLDTPVASFDVTLNGILTAVYVPFPPHPAYLALDPIPDALKGKRHRLRIEITNHASVITPQPPPIWAFVSITNNETQQVTLVTPE